MNKHYLNMQQTYANDLLRAKRRLYLNEVYDMLGLPRTEEGQVVGWIYQENNPIGDNYVDFGITNYVRTGVVDFNVDGVILGR